MAGRPEPSFTHICKRPHRLRNSDAALVVAGPHKPAKRLRGTCRQAGPANSERLGLPPLCPDHVAGLGGLDARAVGQHIVGVGLEALRAAGAPGHGPGAQRAVLGMLGAQQLDAEELGLAGLVRRMLRGPVLAADRDAPALGPEMPTMGVPSTMAKLE